jgi:hypothetical protein
MFSGTLIRSGNNAKTVKGDGVYETAIMYLAPANVSGAGNVCPMALTAHCREACLYSAGRGAFNSVQSARIAKTQRFFADREAFMHDLSTDLSGFVAYCQRKGISPAVRLNGTSDIQFELIPAKRAGFQFPNVFEAFPEIQFYDYSKVYKRAYRQLPRNYSLVLSYSEANPDYASEIMQAHDTTGCNIAVVFRDKETRARYMETGFRGVPVIDGDRDDLRFMDPRGVVVGLYAKGKAKADQSGFVID